MADKITSEQLEQDFLDWMTNAVKGKKYAAQTIETMKFLFSSASVAVSSLHTETTNRIDAKIESIWDKHWPRIKRTFLNVFTNASNLLNYLPSLNEVVDKTTGVLSISSGLLTSGASTVVTTVGNVATDFLTSSTIEGAMASIDNFLTDVGNDFSGAYLEASNSIKENLRTVMSSHEEAGIGSNAITSFFGSALGVFADSLSVYVDGIEETTFGARMENSWHGSSSSFLNTFKNSSSGTYSIKILTSTPLDAGADSENLYGTMILGTPPLFNSVADPSNRVTVNTFLKDAKILSLTPGLPKYNGHSYLNTADNALNQTKDGNEMIKYLLKNGIDKDFSDKDKRYYTFKTDYNNYFSYLETMLNTIWIKLGLATGETGTDFNLFSFFQIDDNNGETQKINVNNYKTLKEQYNSSIGFFINTNGILAESVDSSPTSFGGTLKAKGEQYTDEYQMINYIGGIGTDSAMRQAGRSIRMAGQTAISIGNSFAEMLGNTISGLKNNGLVGMAMGAIKDVQKFTTQEDMGVLLQSFATTNGMRVFYPELWGDSNYSRSININFNFVSPYGDPLSIFQNVFVPFCALACFAFPRQAADNGLVSPFMVRADIPGVFCSDFGLITNFTFTRGGDNNLWTKDGLPRAISGSFSITDLYQYLAMTKRLSFMSSNPSYTNFLDSLCGLHAVYDDSDSSTVLNDYFKKMLNRVNGEIDDSSMGLWNKYEPFVRKINKSVGDTPRRSSLTNKSKNIYWMRSGESSS